MPTMKMGGLSSNTSNLHVVDDCEPNPSIEQQQLLEDTNITATASNQFVVQNAHYINNSRESSDSSIFINCVSFNARSIVNKLPELHTLLSVSTPGLVCITESWLNPGITDSILCDCFKYSIFRKDRISANHGGGVCLLVDNDLFKTHQVCIPDRFSHLEMLVIDVCNSSNKFRIFLCYRPPSGEYDVNALRYSIEMCECIEFLYPIDATVLLCGDFNLPCIDWSNIDISLHTRSSCSGIFVNLFVKLALHQFVSDYTRLNSNTHRGSILDLILCNDVNFVSNTRVADPFSTSDHSMVKFDILNSTISYNVCSSTCDFNRANWYGIFEYLHRIDFSAALDGCADVACKMDCFYSILNACISANVPTVKSNRSTIKNVRYPKHIRRRLLKKSTAWRVYSRFRTDTALNKYKKIAADCRSLIYEYTLKREHVIVNSDNVSSFYRHCNRRFNCRSIIGPIKDSNGDVITDPVGKANLFQKCFDSVYTDDNNVIPLSHQSTRCPVNFNSIGFSPYLVNKAIKKLRTKAKGGPDLIPPIFFTKCALWLSPIIAELFQLCFNSGFMPLIWSTANISPVFKKGDPTDPSNYRPIALTSVLCKLMESIIKDQLMTHLLTHKLISKQQHAFIIKHSTATNLLECINDWTAAIQAGKCVDVVYIDFCRAFDSIVYSKLLCKLKTFGIGGNLLLWIGAFLSNRTQRVCVENCYSYVSCVKSGVPQGSVLGPIMFLLFINDIDRVCNNSSTIKLFADDLKIYSIFDISVMYNSSINYLQDTINRVCLWAAEWQLCINIRKCSALTVHSSLSVSKRSYFINGEMLQYVDPVTDLGVLIDGRLSYKNHINSIVSKALNRIGILFRGFLCRDLYFLRKAFVTYIRPVIEYCSVVWSPCFKKYIDLIEKVQKRFSKRIPCLRALPYKERLSHLNLQPLELRRLHFDLIFYYNILNDNSPIKKDDFFKFHFPPVSSRRPTPFIQKPRLASKQLLSSFRYRSVDCWNSLTPETKNLTSILAFKKSLKNIDLTSFLYGSSFSSLSDFYISPLV
jgi:hypothetical protein